MCKIKKFMQEHRAQFTEAAPAGYDVDRLISMAAHIVRGNEDLQHRASLVDALTRCAGSGLYLHGDEAYLVARYDKSERRKTANFEPGYRGLIRIATTHPDVESVTATLVHEADEFSAEGGDSPRVTHRFNPFATDRGDVIGVYASAQFTSGRMVHEIMSRAEIDSIRANAGTDYVWRSHFGEMARKSAVRRLTKYLPRTEETSRALHYTETEYSAPDDAEPAADPLALPKQATAPQNGLSEGANRGIARVHAGLPKALAPIAEALIRHFDATDLKQAFATIAGINDGNADDALRLLSYPSTIDACAAHGCEDSLIAYVAEVAKLDEETAALAVKWCALTGIAWQGARDKAEAGKQPPQHNGESE